MSMFDAIGRMFSGLLKAWIEGCALHAGATSGRIPDGGDF